MISRTKKILRKSRRPAARVSPTEILRLQEVRRLYDGPQGACLSLCSLVSGHWSAADRLFRERRFDLRGCRSILDIGSGAGQLAQPIARYADPGAAVTCTDLSPEMLRRARSRLRGRQPRFIAADVAQLPFPDGSFDCVTCGYVLEHLPDAAPALAEIGRVLTSRGKFLLLFLEDSVVSRWTQELWGCRTYRRDELQAASRRVGLTWIREIPLDRWQQLTRGKGLCVEMRKA